MYYSVENGVKVIVIGISRVRVILTICYQLFFSEDHVFINQRKTAVISIIRSKQKQTITVHKESWV